METLHPSRGAPNCGLHHLHQISMIAGGWSHGCVLSQIMADLAFG